MTQRIKNFNWLIALFLVTFIGDRTLGFALKKRAEKAPFRYSRLYYADSLDYNIVVVGSSRGLLFHAPELAQLTHKKVFNLSHDGLSADFTSCLAMDYLDRHHLPDVLIVEISNSSFEYAPLRTQFKIFYGQSSRLDSLIAAIHSPEDGSAGLKIAFGSQLSWLFRYNSRFLTRFMTNSPDPNDKEWAWNEIMDSSMFKRIKKGYWDAPPQIAQVKAIEQLIAYAQSKKVKIRVFIAPFFPKLANAIRQPALTPLIHQIEAETTIKVDDYSMLLNDTLLFSNLSHLNRAGSIKLMDTLNKLHFFE
jgi:hypothetical protein